MSAAPTNAPDPARAQRVNEIWSEMRAQRNGNPPPPRSPSLALILAELDACSPEMRAYFLGLRGDLKLCISECHTHKAHKDILTQQLAAERAAHTLTATEAIKAQTLLETYKRNLDEAGLIGVVQMGVEMDLKLESEKARETEKQK